MTHLSRAMVAVLITCLSSIGLEAQTSSVDTTAVQLAASARTTLQPLEVGAKLTVHNVALSTALLDLQNRSGVSLVYSPSLIERVGKVSCECNEISVGAALERMLRGTGLRYTLLGRHILIEPAGSPPFRNDGIGSEPIFQLAQLPALPHPEVLRISRVASRDRKRAEHVAGTLGQAATTGTVVGRVTQAGTGQPLAAATVRVVGTSIGTITSEDGRFMLTAVPAGNHTVEVRLIGYASQSTTVTVVANESVTVNFELATEALLLEGVVAVGYGTRSRRDVTGSIASVQAEQIRQIPTSNAVQAIQGRAAGVDVVRTSSVPGAGMQIRIRGVRSMSNANNRNDPLFVVDGVPLAGGIGDFSPANIQSIEILKDASATAIYGSRGANGVVLITTNTGATGAAQVTYNGYTGMQRPLNLVRMMSGPEFIEYRREAHRTVNPNRTDQEIFGARELAAIQNGEFTDWQREILRTGFQQDHQIGITGSTENTRFALAGNFFEQQGISKEQGFERYNANFAIDHTRGRLRVGASGTAARSSQKIGPGDSVWDMALENHALGTPYDENGLLKPKANDDPLLINPLVAVYENVAENLRNRMFGSFFAEYQLHEGLTFRSTFGPDLTSTTNGRFQSRAARNDAPPSASKNEAETFAYTFTNQLNLNRRLGSAHNLDAMAVYEIQENRTQTSALAAENLPYDHQLWHNLGTAGVRTQLDSNLSRWALASYLGRINYSLFERYLLTVTGRFDGSSRLAADNRWSFFPSVGLGWHVADEPFMQNIGWLSDLKLRASYGVTGNTAVAPYVTQGVLSSIPYNFGNTLLIGWRPSQIPNPALQWEKTHQYNLAVDFGILRNRLAGTIDIYRQDTKDLLLSRGLPPASGFSSVVQNVGETRNSGIEISLSTVNVENWNGLRWTMDFNATHNKNQIVALSEGGDQVANNWFIGYPIHLGGPHSVFFDYEFAGIWQLDEAEEAASYGQKPGEIKVVDQNGDGRINADDRVIIGNSYPDWVGSLSNRFTYGNVDLSILATARLGYKFADTFSDRHTRLDGRYNNMLVDYWTPTNPSNEHPRPDAGRQFPLWGSSRLYRKGDHFRIRNITLGYRVPSGLISRLGGNSMRIYTTIQDPYVFTDYQGYDPEFGTFGATPSYWTFLVGTNLSF